MMDAAMLDRIVVRARLAPSVHNTQPARWRQVGDAVEVLCDGSVGHAAGDPAGRDAGLSCGAAVEATVIALSQEGLAASVTETWSGAGPGLRPVARIVPGGAVAADPMADQMDRRFTFRSVFEAAPAPLFGWQRRDAALLTDPARKDWIAGLNDAVSLGVLRDAAVRAELLHWMRLSPRHPRYDHDGMSRAALRMDATTALGARLVLGPLWGLCDRLGLTGRITAEAEATRSAQVIACFHRPADESPVASGRAYLRMWLEATHLGMAGWPMAALADTESSRAEVSARISLAPDRRLIQVIRFGVPVGDPPPRARRPLSELIV